MVHHLIKISHNLADTVERGENRARCTSDRCEAENFHGVVCGTDPGSITDIMCSAGRVDPGQNMILIVAELNCILGRLGFDFELRRGAGNVDIGNTPYF